MAWHHYFIHNEFMLCFAVYVQKHLRASIPGMRVMSKKQLVFDIVKAMDVYCVLFIECSARLCGGYKKV